MYILALADIHQPDGKLLNRIKPLADEAAWILIAGDFDTKTAYNELKASYKDKLVAVKGNTNEDPILPLKLEEKITIDGIKFGLIHKVSESSADTFDEPAAQAAAVRLDVDALIFGHIHQPVVVWGSKLLICPGRGGTGASVKKFKGVSVALIELIGGKISSIRINLI
jgi:putative phosphoesterase